MKDLFPLVQSDLDLGLYGVMHAKSAETEVGVANLSESSGGLK